MKATLTQENKVKFFALYWGQVIGLGLNDQLDINKSKFRAQSAFTECIELKSLSQISDVDKNELLLFVDKVLPISEKFATGFGIDFLRSKGYALPWMGLSVEEMIKAGWIKLL